MVNRLTHDDLMALPKVELHVHLDCSLSFDLVSKLNPEISIEKYNANFIAPEKCLDLADFLRCTVSSIDLMQSSNNLKFVVSDLFKQLKKENVVYAEIRFAPLLHTRNGLEPEDVIEIVTDAVEENINNMGIHSGLILCTLRHFTEEQGLQTVKLTQKYMETSPVVGFDIAADEAGFPIDNHINAFKYAIKNDIPRTAHAGEARGPESMWETIEYFKPARIGHGVRSIEDNKLIDFLLKNDIHLEICPTCNIQTDVFYEYSDHSVNELYKRGISLGINTDARTLTNISLTKEYTKLQEVFGWGKEDLKQCNINALKNAFTKDKEELINRIIKEYQ